MHSVLLVYFILWLFSLYYLFYLDCISIHLFMIFLQSIVFAVTQ